MADVRGQLAARRGVEVAAAGGHNILLIGSPGIGKSMLAERLPGILPPMTHREKLETTMVHSASGLQPPGAGLVEERPFRAPHHTVSVAGMIGGGRPARPGEVSLAHRGVLFLDEMPEFRRHVLEALRQPLETGTVLITRSGSTVRFPCRFQLAAAMNPCPCGLRLDPRGGCRCSPQAVARYLGRISGPLLDRIDMHIEMATVSFAEMTRTAAAEDSAAIRARVWEAYRRQRERFGDHSRVLVNSQMGLQETRDHCRLGPRPLGLLRTAVGRLGLSPRAFHRILRLARTIADLAGAAEIGETHVSEAIGYRLLDRGKASR
jgi:magnesium chelatase family protein